MRTGLWVQSAEELHLGSKLCPRDPQKQNPCNNKGEPMKSQGQPLWTWPGKSALSVSQTTCRPPLWLIKFSGASGFWKRRSKWSENRSVMSNSLWPHGLYNPWNSPSQNTWVGSCSLLQGIFTIPGIKPGSPAWQANSLPAELQGSPCKRRSCRYSHKRPSYNDSRWLQEPQRATIHWLREDGAGKGRGHGRQHSWGNSGVSNQKNAATAKRSFHPKCACLLVVGIETG